MQEKDVDNLNILIHFFKGVHSLNMQTRKRHSQFKYTKRRLSQSEHTRKRRWLSEHTRTVSIQEKGIHSLNIQKGGVGVGGGCHSLNIQEKAVHSLNMHTGKRRLQSEHTQKRYSQSEHARIWNRITASILKQDPNTKRFKRTLTYYVTDTRYAKSYFRSCVRVEVAVLGCPS